MSSLAAFADDQKNLEILAEEAAEVIQVKSKIVRFGMLDIYPEHGETNQARLEQEVGDFLVMVDILKARGVLTDAGLDRAKRSKLEKLQRWY